MFELIEKLYLEISNWLIQKIDADPKYYEPVNEYLLANNPDEYALYMALEQMMRKIENKNNN